MEQSVSENGAVDMASKQPGLPRGCRVQCCDRMPSTVW